MRPRYKTPKNKKYFHTNPKIDNKDVIFTKSRIQMVRDKKLKRCRKEKKKNITF
jgi:hypothetical protein